MRKGLWIGLSATVVAAAVVWGASDGRKAAPVSCVPTAAACVDDRNSDVQFFEPAPETPLVIAQAGREQPALVRTEPFAAPFSPDPNDPFGPPLALPNLGPAPVEPSANDGPVDALAVDPAPLRARLLDEVARKAQLMSVEQLHQEIQREAATIRELQAARELDRARRALEELSKSHPETKAGKSAGQMLRASPAADGFRPVHASDAPLFPGSVNDSFTPAPTPRRRT